MLDYAELRAEFYMPWRRASRREVIARETNKSAAKVLAKFGIGLVNDPTGIQGRETIPVHTVSYATHLILFIAYYERDINPALTTRQRDDLIRTRHAAGEGISELARAFAISPQRVHQIVNFRMR
jgi:hypothetical protein